MPQQRSMRDIVELVLPQRCAGCGVSGAGVCPACRTLLRTVHPRPTRPDPCPSGMPPTWAASAYSGSLRTAIIAWKDQDRADLSRWFVPMVARALVEALVDSPQWTERFRQAGVAIVVPVPSRASGTRTRGRFPVAELVTGLLDPRRTSTCGLLGMHALSYGRAVRDQSGLDHLGRANNVAGSMRVAAPSRASLAGTPIVLIDDIVTTGSTIAEATRALRAVGAGPVLAVCLAATQRQAQLLPDRDPHGAPSRAGAD
ncbi:MAG: phosphoribosyltransferase family protein [Ornithinimicrobium sp.]